MANDKYFGTQKVISQANKMVPNKKISNFENAFGRGSNQHAQLSAVKDIAELWLQADLNKCIVRKMKLETELEAVLSSLAEDSVSPISAVFKQIRSDSKHKSL